MEIADRWAIPEGKRTPHGFGQIWTDLLPEVKPLVPIMVNVSPPAWPSYVKLSTLANEMLATVPPLMAIPNVPPLIGAGV